METENQESNPNWLYAHYDPLAQFYTFSSCIAFADLNGDGDHKLVIADLGTGSYNMTIKVLKGTSVVQENALLDLPTGVASVFMDVSEPRTPGIVVASGSSLFIYKNMRPYYKYNLPLLNVNTDEARLWNNASNGDIDPATLAEGLANLRKNVEASMLTTRTSQFLQLQSDEECLQFIDNYKNKVIKHETVITCLTTIKKSIAEDDAISSIVIGTEHKQVLIVDSEAFTSLQLFEILGVPVFINVSGVFDVDFRLFVACRDGKVYVLRKDSKAPRVCLELNSQIVGLERVNKLLVIALMDKSFSCFTTKGKLVWTVEMPCNILCTAIMDHKTKGFKAVMVGLENNEVKIYRDKNLVDTIRLNDKPQALCFGKFGRENSTLIAVLASGALQVLILKRTVEYTDHSSHRGPPSSQRIKLNIPKKTQLFVDQTVRERENSKEMFQNFQRDLQLMRLNVSHTYLKGLKSSITPISDDPRMPLKLSASIQGIGPCFQMLITVENTSAAGISDAKLATGLLFLLSYSDTVYAVSPQMINLPALVPEVPYKFSVCVQCIATDGLSQDNVTAIITKRGTLKPLVTANILMPVSESTVIV